jgi:hypothetical protein
MSDSSAFFRGFHSKAVTLSAFLQAHGNNTDQAEIGCEKKDAMLYIMPEQIE